MPRRAAPLPDELAESFGVSRARGTGVTAGRLRAKDLDRPFRGTRLRPPVRAAEVAEPEPLAFDREVHRAVMRRAGAYAHVMPAHAFFAGRTAAVVYKLPVSHDPSGELWVAVHAPARALRAEGVHGMKVSPTLASVRAWDGLRVSSPASTWAMLSNELTVRELIIVGDAVVRIPRDGRGQAQPHRRLASIEQLRQAASAPWRRGRAALDEALESIRVGSMSPLETDFRLGAVAGGLPEPDLDVEVRDRHGRLLGISDAVYPQQRTVVEVEGDHHRATKAQWNRDIQKYAAYAAEGWEVLRLTAEHIRGPRREAPAMVRDVLLRRGWRP
jgi:hypothetical protein